MDPTPPSISCFTVLRLNPHLLFYSELDWWESAGAGYEHPESEPISAKASSRRLMSSLQRLLLDYHCRTRPSAASCLMVSDISRAKRTCASFPSTMFSPSKLGIAARTCRIKSSRETRFFG